MAWGNELEGMKKHAYLIFIEVWKIAGLVCVSLVLNRMAEKISCYFDRQNDELAIDDEDVRTNQWLTVDMTVNAEIVEDVSEQKRTH